MIPYEIISYFLLDITVHSIGHKTVTISDTMYRYLKLHHPKTVKRNRISGLKIIRSFKLKLYDFEVN